MSGEAILSMIQKLGLSETTIAKKSARYDTSEAREHKFWNTQVFALIPSLQQNNIQLFIFIFIACLTKF